MKAEDLGTIRRQFQPGIENLVAGIILGALLSVGGCAAVGFAIAGVWQSGGSLPIWTEDGQKGWCWGAAGICAALGIALVVGGVVLIRWVRSLFSLRVCMASNGFSVRTKQTTQAYAWDEVVAVQETHLYERPPVLKGVAKYALPKLMSKSYSISIQGAGPFGFDGTTIKGHSKLAKLIKEETERRKIPWTIVEEHG